jgi:hypothetical protein
MTTINSATKINLNDFMFSYKIKHIETGFYHNLVITYNGTLLGFFV